MSRDTQETVLIVDLEGNAADRMRELDQAMDKVIKRTQAQRDRFDLLRGETDSLSDRLKFFGERGLQAANALEEISDPTKRAALATALLNQQVRQIHSPMGRLSDSVLELKARFNGLPQATQLAIKGVAGLALAVGTALVAAIGKAIEKNKELNAQWELSKRHAESLTAKVGELALGDGGLSGLEKATKAANVVLNTLAERMDIASQRSTQGKVAVEGFKTVASALLAGPLFPLITGIRLLNEAFEDSSKKTLEAKESYMEYIRTIAQDERDEEKRRQFEEIIKRNERHREQSSKPQQAPDIPTLDDYENKEKIFMGEMLRKAQELDQQARREERAKKSIVKLIGEEEAKRLKIIDAKGKEATASAKVNTELDKELKKRMKIKDLLESAGLDDDPLGLGFKGDKTAKGVLEEEGAKTPDKVQDLLEAAGLAGSTPAFQPVQTVNQALDDLSNEKAEKLKKLKKEFPTKQLEALGAAARQTGLDMAFMLGQVASGDATLADFGNALKGAIGGLLQSLAPAFMELGVALLASETGNAIALIGAAGVMAYVAGRLKSGAGGSRGGGSVNTGSGGGIEEASRRFQSLSSKDREDKAPVFYLQFDEDELAPVVTRVGERAVRDNRARRHRR